MAERVGFEPTVPLPARRISSAVLSTSQPPLRIDQDDAARRSPGSVAGGALAAASANAKGLTACLAGSVNYIGHMSIVPASDKIPTARYGIGEMVRHRLLDFRGVIFDVDPEFANSDEWYEAIPEAMRPAKDQPFYHLLAENAESSYVAYVSQQNLVRDDEGEPIDHPAIGTLFAGFDGERYKLKPEHRH